MNSCAASAGCILHENVGVAERLVSEASDGSQAVENALKSVPDVVVLDIAMPKLSGIDAAMRINAQLPHTQIIILSMHSDEGYVSKASPTRTSRTL